MTPQTIAVLRVLLEDPAMPRYGLDIARVSGLKTGTLHPILRRLEQAGLIASSWENLAEQEVGRPRRRYYRLVDHGAITVAHQAVARADAAAAASGGPALRPQPGH